MKTLSSILITTFCVLLFYGCAYDGVYQGCSNCEGKSVAANQLITENYHATDVLISQARNKLAPGLPILITTLVNIDDLEKSSTFGRVTAENIATRFFQAGIKVIEMKLSKNIYMKKDEGELGLTREITNIAKDYHAQAIVIGTYGTSKEFVFINVKLVVPGNNTILAAYDYVIPLNDEIRTLLSLTRSPSWRPY